MRVNPKKNLPAYVKINAIMDYFDGKMAKRAIAEKYGVSHVSIINWVKEKDDLLRECKESARLLEGQQSITFLPVPLHNTSDAISSGIFIVMMLQTLKNRLLLNLTDCRDILTFWNTMDSLLPYRTAMI